MAISAIQTYNSKPSVQGISGATSIFPIDWESLKANIEIDKNKYDETKIISLKGGFPFLQGPLEWRYDQQTNERTNLPYTMASWQNLYGGTKNNIP